MLDEAMSVPHTDDVPEVAVCHDAAGQRILFYGQGIVAWGVNSRYGTSTAAAATMGSP